MRSARQGQVRFRTAALQCWMVRREELTTTSNYGYELQGDL